MRIPGLPAPSLLLALFAFCLPPAFAQSPVKPLLPAAQQGGSPTPAGASTRALFPAVSQTDRVLWSVDTAQGTRLSGHIPAWADPAADRGPIADSTPLGIVVSLSRAPQVQAAFDQLLADQQNPSSPRYHHWLTPQQVGELYGPTQDDVDAVTNWLVSKGLKVDNITPSRIFIQASGSAAVVSAAFQTSLHSFALASRTLQAPTSEPMIPTALAPVAAFIGGLAEVDYRTDLHTLPSVLNTQTNIPSASAASSAIQPHFTLGGGVHYIAPADFATIYDLSPAYSAGTSGTGQRVAIIGGSRLLASDLTYWESISGLTSYQPNYIVGSCTGCSDPGVTSDDNQAEGTLDFDRVYGTAPGAQVDQIISSNWLNGTVTYNLILYAINTVKDPILSLSFGACEAKQSPSFLAYENSIFSQAASQGIGVFASSGDSGVAGCEPQGVAPPATQIASISDICSSPYVTCVGGTQFSDTTSTSTYWSSTNNPSNAGSALSYIPEGAWNEPTSTNNSGATIYVVSATGGGPSTVQPKPSWQVGAGVPADNARDVPDVSFSASGHNAYFACFAAAGGANPPNCVPNAQGQFYLTGFGGTSASAPSMAGIAALLNQKLGSAQGNLNPTLYRVAASTPAAFHDPTPATSGVASCTTATPTTCNNSNPSPTGLAGGIAGYPLTVGYDLDTGLGSLDVTAFLTAAAVPTLAATTDALAANPTTITTAQTAVFTATITSTTTGTPTGTVQFTSNGINLGSPVTLVNGVASTASLPFTTAGTYTIAAAYSGDTVYASSNATISFIVTTPVLPTTSTVLAGTASNITTQQTVSYTATVTSTASGTPTGSVQFVSNNGSGATNIGSPIALSGGKATLPATSFAAGSYNITGIYSGDASFTGSTSPAVALTVTSVPTVTSIPTAPQTVSSIQALTFTAAIAPTAGNTGTPSGTVQFMVDNIARGKPVALTGSTATSPGITFTPGTHAVTAVYSGDAIFSTSTSGSASVTSTIEPTSIAFTTVPTTIAQYASTSVTATLSGLSANVATTASVTFKDTTTGATLATPTITYSGSTATATISSLSFATSGNHTITAMFTGDTNYSPSNTTSATIAVTAVTITLTPTNSSLTLSAGASGTDPVSAVATNFSGTESLTCAVNFNGPGTATDTPTCSFSPSSLSFSGSGSMSSTLTISSVAASAITGTRAFNRPSGLFGRTGMGAAALASLFLLILPRRRSLRTIHLFSAVIFLAAALAALSGCGSGSSTAPSPNPGTTKGSYDITINANSALNQPGNVGYSGTIQLTIQ